MTTLADLRARLERRKAAGGIECVIMPSFVWQEMKEHYIRETKRLGPLEISGREVLGVQVEVDDEAGGIIIVRGDQDDEFI